MSLKISPHDSVTYQCQLFSVRPISMENYNNSSWKCKSPHVQSPEPLIASVTPCIPRKKEIMEHLVILILNKVLQSIISLMASGNSFIVYINSII